MATELCPGGEKYPTNYDGTFTRCDTCGRRCKLNPEGLVPKHKPGIVKYPSVYTKDWAKQNPDLTGDE